MDCGDDLQKEWRRRGDVEATVVGDQAVLDGPRRHAGACDDLIPKGNESRIHSLCLTKAVDEVETWRRQRQDRPRAVLGVAARQRIDDRVLGARLVLHGEVEPQELPDPVMLRDHGKPLV